MPGICKNYWECVSDYEDAFPNNVYFTIMIRRRIFMYKVEAKELPYEDVQLIELSGLKSDSNTDEIEIAAPAANAVSYSCSSIKVSWKPVPQAQGYQIYRATSAVVLIVRRQRQ